MTLLSKQFVGGARNNCIAWHGTTAAGRALFRTFVMSGMEMEKLCERLDRVLLEVMRTLQELSQLREQYSAAVREVSTLFMTR